MDEEIKEECNEGVESLRQPIVAVLGHVDHGKTSLLDFVRGTAIVDREAGAITQHIGATEVPLNDIVNVCGELIKKDTIELPGLLFIDTPGHQAFSSLRTRGGGLADLAILVIDFNEGFKPQTVESLRILKQQKTPFVVALNKIDKISGWTSKGIGHLANAKNQPSHATEAFQNRLWEIMADFGERGFDAAPYWEIDDFSKKIALVPTSVKETGEGIPELFMVLMGLAQKYLKKRLKLDEGMAEGTVLEMNEEKGLGKSLSIILYNGTLNDSDNLVIGATNEPVVTRVKKILRPNALDEIRDPRMRFESSEIVKAAAGIKIVAPDLDGVVAGAPIYGVSNDDELENALSRLEESMIANVELDDEGIVIKADAIGSLEGLASELKEVGYPVLKAGIGDISKKDIILAETSKPELRAILGFNVKVLPEAKNELENSEVMVFESDIVYRLIDDYKEWRRKYDLEEEERVRKEFAHPGKYEILEGCVFRTRGPAVVGVRVHAGRIATGQRVLRSDNVVVGRIKSMRRGDEVIKEANQGDEVAIAISNVTVGRQIKENDILYIEMNERDIIEIREAGVKLNLDEEEVIEEMQKIKKKDSPFWGR
tara:strand:+ start:5754 stop:7550 length:1797 start_codon:yes stop_codon:yes gene_type:complete